MLLLANALIFFHMARVQSLELNTRVAALIAVSLIVTGALMLLGSILVYSMRVRKAAPDLPPLLRNQEVAFARCTLVLFVFIMVVFSSIAWIISHGSLSTLEAPPILRDAHTSRQVF